MLPNMLRKNRQPRESLLDHKSVLGSGIGRKEVTGASSSNEGETAGAGCFLQLSLIGFFDFVFLPITSSGLSSSPSRLRASLQVLSNEGHDASADPEAREHACPSQGWIRHA